MNLTTIAVLDRKINELRRGSILGCFFFSFGKGKPEQVSKMSKNPKERFPCVVIMKTVIRIEIN